MDAALPDIELISIDDIHILNPRVRGPKVFAELVESIEKVGLKRPITVSRNEGGSGEPYRLVCGQGRLEAFKKLGQSEIPAIVIEASQDDCFVMSLVENMARRHRPAIEWVKDVESLYQRDNSLEEIARKTGLSSYYIRCILRLLEKGEERLLSAVSAGTVPVTIAMEIAEVSGPEAQRVLQEAYENKAVKGKKFLAIKRLIEKRRTLGKGRSVERRAKPQTAKDFVRVYSEQVEKQKLLVKKAEISHSQLLFLVEGMRTALENPRFHSILHAEGLASMPACLAERLDFEE